MGTISMLHFDVYARLGPHWNHGRGNWSTLPYWRIAAGMIEVLWYAESASVLFLLTPANAAEVWLT